MSTRAPLALGAGNSHSPPATYGFAVMTFQRRDSGRQRSTPTKNLEMNQEMADTWQEDLDGISGSRHRSCRRLAVADVAPGWDKGGEGHDPPKDEIVVVRPIAGRLQVSTLIKNEEFKWQTSWTCPFIDCGELFGKTVCGKCACLCTTRRLSPSRRSCSGKLFLVGRSSEPDHRE
jgi:hypothetical protein